MSKILITGSSGRIGRALHWRLSQNNDVTGIDLSPSSSTSAIVDIRNYEHLLKCLQGVDTIFHVAALHAPHVGIASERQFYEINVNATENICRAAIETGVSRLVFTSTTALYGHANRGVERAAWVNEKTIPEPRTIYHKTKLEAEGVIKEYASDNLVASVIRMSRCFPEPADVMAVYRLHRGIDYRDVAEAHILASQSKQDKNYEVYVVSGETPFQHCDSIELFENSEAIIRQRSPLLAKEFDSRGWKFPKSIDRVYDSTYAQERLGWRPKIGSFEIFEQLDRGDIEVLPPVGV